MIRRLFVAASFACLACFYLPVFGQDTPYSQFFPPTDDDELSVLFTDSSVEWYTHHEMPPVFQHDFGNPFVSIYKDIGPGGPRFSNGNGEWPWAHPATATNDDRTKAIVGVKLPNKPSVFRVNLSLYSISTFPTEPGRYEVRKSGSRSGINWRFPVGTEFIELNLNQINDGDCCYKVHRMTMQPNGNWLFRVYRPWDNREEYEQDTGTKAVEIGPMRMRSQHMNAAFDRTISMFKVPPIDGQKSIELLTNKPFKLCKSDDFIPTTDTENQAWPKGYLGAFIGNGVNQDNCRVCHQHVLKDVRQFDNGEWYGHVRGGGNDTHGAGVFSWYPR